MKQLLILMLCSVTALAGTKYATVTGAGSHTGTSLGNAWTMLEANAGAMAGDVINFSSGLYSDRIDPVNSGTIAAPIVYQAATAAFCSLAVAGPVVNGFAVNYITIDGWHIQQISYQTSSPVYFLQCRGIWMKNCRIWGGTSCNTLFGNPGSVVFDSCDYCVVTRSRLDRQDTAITNDDYRSEGFVFMGNTKYSVFERDTATHVSHYAFKVDHGPYGGGLSLLARHTYNTVRNCVAFANHVNFGGTDWTWGALYEGNISWAPGQANTYRDGLNAEYTGRFMQIRWCAHYHDSTDQNNGASNWITEGGTVSTQSYAASTHNCVFLGNLFMSQSSMNRRKDCLLEIYDATPGDSLGLNVYKNNVFAYPSHTELGAVPYQWQGLTHADSMINNDLYTGTSATLDTVAQNGDSGTKYRIGSLSGLIHLMFWGTNYNYSPGWKDSLSHGSARSFELASTSQLIDRGIAPALVSANVGSSKIVPVTDSRWYHYATGRNPNDGGDSCWVRHAGTWVVGKIDSIDWANNNLIFTDHMDGLSVGDSVYIKSTYSIVNGYINRFSGARPDIGPYEYGAVSTPPASPAIQIMPGIRVGYFFGRDVDNARAEYGQYRIRDDTLTLRYQNGSQISWLHMREP